MQIYTKSKYSGLRKDLSLVKSQRLEVEFRLFRKIFTLLKLKQKELALNLMEILQLNTQRFCSW